MAFAQIDYLVLEIFNHPARLRELIADLVRSLEILSFTGGLPFFDQLLDFYRNI